jgi:hypothetical protein
VEIKEGESPNHRSLIKKLQKQIASKKLSKKEAWALKEKLLKGEGEGEEEEPHEEDEGINLD